MRIITPAHLERISRVRYEATCFQAQFRAAFGTGPVKAFTPTGHTLLRSFKKRMPDPYPSSDTHYSFMRQGIHRGGFLTISVHVNFHSDSGTHIESYWLNLGPFSDDGMFTFKHTNVPYPVPSYDEVKSEVDEAKRLIKEGKDRLAMLRTNFDLYVDPDTKFQ